MTQLEKEKEEKYKIVNGLEMKLSDAQTKLHQVEKAYQGAKEHNEKIVSVYESK